MNNELKKINKKCLLADSRGFTLLFSLLIMTIILSASLGIYNIVARQFKISQISRESHKAYYAADTGVECALYWDIKKNEFSDPAYNITCLGQNKSGSLVASSTFFSLSFSNGSCVIIDIDKTGPTVITAYGYNNGDANSTCAATAPLQVERVLRASY